MNNKNIFYYLKLIILYILASPFIIGFFIIFFIVYILIAPIEILIYKRSLYYQNLGEKYYLLITSQEKYKLYNNIVKANQQKELIINNETIIAYYNNNYLLVPIKYHITLINNEYYFNNISITNFTKQINTNLNVIYLINRNQISDNELYKTMKNNKQFLIYEK